jgi:glycosyltransferase involved in cell wall biosynthesis
LFVSIAGKAATLRSVRICVDVQSGILQRAGVGRYTKQLVQHLGRHAGRHELRLFYYDFQRKGVPFPAEHAVFQANRLFPGRFVQAAWKRLGWPPYDLFAGAADLYHFPNFILPPLRRGKAVVSIHDVGFLRFPQFVEDRNYRYLTAKIGDTVRRADAIIADSAFTATEIEELLPADPSRVFTVHLGIEPDFKRAPAEEVRAALSARGVDRPYLLTVSTIEPRKNIGLLIDLFERLVDFDGLLVIAGGLGWKYEPILERIRTSPRQADIRWIDYQPDTVLPALYTGAEAFLCASFYEGFGFPPLEAMACGTPVVTSTGGSLGEVLGTAAERVETFDVEEWVAAVRRVLADTERRRTLVEAGLRQSAGYTWDETARRTWAVYEKIANAGRSA